MNKILISILIMACLAFPAAINVAVIETEIDAGSAASKEIEPAELRYITQEIRRLATNSLPKPKYSIMTEQTVQAQGDAVLQECDGENCIVSLGAKIGADFITRGTLSKFRKKYTLSVEIYDTRNGMLAVSLDEPIESEDLDDLLDGFRKTAPAFFKKLDGKSGSGPSPGSSPPKPSSGISLPNVKTSTWAAIGLDVLGAAAIGFGIYQNSQLDAHKKAYGDVPEGSSPDDFNSAYGKAEDAKGMRNIGYIAGAALLAAGISIHFFF